jgi:CheY-like chemotaxis protein
VPIDHPDTGLPVMDGVSEAGEARTILLVDDDVLVRMGTEALLSSLGYRVIAADSGPAALRSLESGGRADALATDYAMPGMSGAELVREVRRRRPKLPVLLMTGYNKPPERIDNAIVMQKPFSPSELASNLARLIDGMPGGL